MFCKPSSFSWLLTDIDEEPIGLFCTMEGEGLEFPLARLLDLIGLIRFDAERQPNENVSEAIGSPIYGKVKVLASNVTQRNGTAVGLDLASIFWRGMPRPLLSGTPSLIICMLWALFAWFFG
jgi:hypothetical protein